MASSLPESRVLIIMTGGTICMRPSPEGLVPAKGFMELGMAPRPSFNDGSKLDPLPVYTTPTTLTHLPSLRTPPTTYARHIRYTLHEFPILLDSSSISSAGWSQIAQTIYSNYALFDGFVVLHGTDSLSYTASALSFMLTHLGKPVILTGSQTSIFALASDAVDNLLGSLIIAGTFHIPEVLLFFHHTLYRGNRTTKISATSFAAFASPNLPPLATINALGAEVSWSLVRRPRSLEKFEVQHTLDTAHVACLRVFPGIKPEMLDSVLRVPGLKGLILETFGAGNAPSGEDGSFVEVVRRAVARGIVIVNVSQCPSGSVSPLYAPATVLGNAGVVFGHDLTTEAALTKLSYLLALEGLSYQDIVERMGVNLRGEMTSVEKMPSFKHPERVEESLGEGEARFAALGYAIRRGDVGVVRRMCDVDEGLVGMVDYAGNGVLHLAVLASAGKGEGQESEKRGKGQEDEGKGVGSENPREEGDTRREEVASETMMKELLSRGANVHVRNATGMTPLGLAERVGSRKCIELLKKSGALLHAEEMGEKKL